MSLTRRVLGSSALLVGIKVVQRSLGLVSLLILARLLSPEDFGLIALVSITVHFFDILANVGSEQYIIQKQSVGPDDLNTAWTLDLLMKTALWLVLMLSAPLLADFFTQPALAPALWAGASVLLINALRNPGLFLLQQSFEYTRIFWLSVLQRVLTFVVVIGVAWVERSYWALIIGDIVSSAVFTAGSYLISTHRPRLCRVHVAEQWRFSGWMLLRGVVGYTRSQLDTLFISRLFPAAQLGQYYLARDVAMLPAHNLIMPAAEPLLALFRHSRHDRHAMQAHLSFSLYVVSLLVVPIALFIAVFPAPVIRVLLGEQWLPAVPVLSAMSLLLLYFAYVAVYEKVLIAHARVRLLFAIDLLSLIIVGSGLGLATGFGAAPGMAAIALLRGVLGVINLGVIAAACRAALGLRMESLAAPLACCLLSATVALTVAALAVTTLFGEASTLWWQATSTASAAGASAPGQLAHPPGTLAGAAEALLELLVLGSTFCISYALCLFALVRLLPRTAQHRRLLELLGGLRRGAPAHQER